MQQQRRQQKKSRYPNVRDALLIFVSANKFVVSKSFSLFDIYALHW